MKYDLKKIRFFNVKCDTKYGDFITKIITFLSDFGLKDGYVAQMKGVVSSLCTAQLVDITHDVQPFNILHGAFVLRNIVSSFPNQTIHVAVVDPGVGTKRKAIIVITESQTFIGPDNGLLIPAACLFKKLSVYEITNEKYMQSPISNTFHGRDIFAPVAAHLCNGVSPHEIGEKTQQYIAIDFGEGEQKQNSIGGKIIYIDHFGNCITNIAKDLLLQYIKYGDKICLSIGGKCFEVFFAPSYGFVKKDEILITVGSSNYIEINVSQGNAAQRLQVRQTDNVKIFFN